MSRMRYVVTGGTGFIGRDLGYPDSAAARGVAEDRPAPVRRPRRPVRPVPALRVPRTVKKAVRLVPGVPW